MGEIVFAEPQCTRYSVMSAKLCFKSSGSCNAVKKILSVEGRGSPKSSKSAGKRENIAEGVPYEYQGELSQYYIAECCSDAPWYKMQENPQ